MRTGFDVPRQQSKYDGWLLLEPIDQLEHAGKDVHSALPGVELFMEAGDVFVEELFHLRVDLHVREAFESHRLPHYLPVCLSIVAVFGGAGRSVHRRQRTLHRNAANASTAKDGSIDIEKNESQVRVRKRPEMIV